jgi:hypothetical protein
MRPTVSFMALGLLLASTSNASFLGNVFEKSKTQVLVSDLKLQATTTTTTSTSNSTTKTGTKSYVKPFTGSYI